MIWALIAAVILWAVLTHIPYVQRRMGEAVASALRSQTGVRVTVGRVQTAFPLRIVIDSISIDDRSSRPFINISRAMAKISLLPIIQGKIEIPSLQIFDAHVRLYRERAEAETNYQFLIDAFSPKKRGKKNRSVIHLESLIIKNSTATWDEWDKAPTPRRLDIHHLDISDFAADIIINHLSGDSIKGEIRRLSFKERSGLDISNITTGKIEMKLPVSSSKRLPLPDFSLLMPRSVIQMDDGVMSCKAAAADFAFLLPRLKDSDEGFVLSARTSVGMDKITVGDLNLSTAAGDMMMEAKKLERRRIDGDGGARRARLTGGGIRLVSSGTAVCRLLTLFGLAPPTEKMGTWGDITLAISDLMSDDLSVYKTFSLHGIAFSSDHGGLSADIDGDGYEIKADIATDSLDIGSLTAAGDLGRLTSDIRLSCAVSSLGKKSIPSATFSADCLSLDYKGYVYTNASVRGSSASDGLTAHISVNDPNIVARVDASIGPETLYGPNSHAITELTGRHVVSLDASLRMFSPHNLRLSDRWGASRFGGDLQAVIHPDEATVSLTNFSKNDSDTLFTIPWLEIKMLTCGKDSSTITLSSDFARLHFSDHDGKANMTARLSSAEWARQLLGVDISLDGSPLTISARASSPGGLSHLLSGDYRDVRASAACDAFSLAGSRYKDMKLTVTSAGDSLLSSLSLSRPSASLSLDLKSAYVREEETPVVIIRPSTLFTRDTTWYISPARIYLRGDHIDISHFDCGHDGEHLSINGSVGKNPSQSLTVSLRQIDLGYILNLLNYQAAKLDGLATGEIAIASVLRQPNIHGQLIVDNFLFNKGRMGQLDARIDWNKTEGRMDVSAIAYDGPDATTSFNGYLSTERHFIDLDIGMNGTHTDFIQTFTKSFVNDFDGHAHGNIRLFGSLGALNLTGSLVIDASVFIRTLNCVYKFRNDTVRLIPDNIIFDRLPFCDAQGHSAFLSGTLHHKNLKNFTYDLSIDADNLLCYDFSEFGTKTFCGTVFGTGGVDIHGRSGLLTINADITPEAGSAFVYNADVTDAITHQDFITWNLPSLNSGDEKGRQIKSPPKKNTNSDIYLNFTINTNPNALLSVMMTGNAGDNISLRGNGVINASYYNKRSLQLFGTYTTTEGSYVVTIQDVLKKKFTFRPGGTINFVGDPYEAKLNLQAVNTVSGVSLSDLGIGGSFTNNTVKVNCLMNITGEPKAPVVDFDIELPNVNAAEEQMVRSVINSEEEMNQQVVALLGVGRFYIQNSNNAATGTQSSQTSLAMQSLLSGAISSQLNEIIGKVVNTDSWNFGTNISTGNEGWNNAEYEGTLSGRLLNNRLLVNGQFGYRDRSTLTQANAEQTIIGDFDVRYLLQPNGNLALKVYNQTNDRYFTRSSLNTQGFGIIMKKDFNGLRELLRRSRSESYSKP